MKKSLSILVINLMILVLGMMAVHGQDVREVVIDPTNPMKINIGTYNYGVFRHLYGGDPISSQEPWDDYNNGLIINNFFVYILSLAIDPLKPNRMFLGTYGSGVCRSLNGGNNWYQANTGLPSFIVYALAINPSDPSKIFAGTNFGISRSEDGGQSWVDVLLTPQETIMTLAIDPNDPDTIYAGTHHGQRIFKSEDGGDTWFPANNNLNCPFVNEIAVDPNNPNTVYAGTFCGVYKSVNGGIDWNHVLPTSYVYAVAIDPKKPNYVYAGSFFDGVYKSENYGVDWLPKNNGLTYLGVYDLAIDWDNPLKIFAATGYGLFKSTDAGEHWFQVY